MSASVVLNCGIVESKPSSWADQAFRDRSFGETLEATLEEILDGMSSTVVHLSFVEHSASLCSRWLDLGIVTALTASDHAFVISVL